MMDKDLNRILHELPAIIGNAEQCDRWENDYIIKYLRRAIGNNEEQDNRATSYFLAALSNLSESEIDRIGKGLHIPGDKISPVEIMYRLPSLTKAATERLITKFAANNTEGKIKGRPKRSLDREYEYIKLGSFVVQRLHRHQI